MLTKTHPPQEQTSVSHLTVRAVLRKLNSCCVTPLLTPWTGLLSKISNPTCTQGWCVPAPSVLWPHLLPCCLPLLRAPGPRLLCLLPRTFQPQDLCTCCSLCWSVAPEPHFALSSPSEILLKRSRRDFSTLPQITASLPPCILISSP